jgi:hypothetical protein
MGDYSQMYTEWLYDIELDGFNGQFNNVFLREIKPFGCFIKNPVLERTG